MTGVFDVAALGPNADGFWDDAFIAAIDSGAPLIYLRAGRYRLRFNLVLLRPASMPPITIICDGGYMRRPAVFLDFEDGRGLILPAPIGGSSNPSGVGTQIRDLAIWSNTPKPNAINGVEIHCGMVKFENVSVFKFGGEGVRLDGRADLGRNCNEWRLLDMWIEDCGEWGVHARGSDAGQGYARLKIHTCGGGAYDSSFVGGNTWTIAVENPNAHLPSFKSDKPPSVWIGCKEERSVAPPSEIGEPAIWIGTLPANGIVAPAGMQLAPVITGIGTYGGMTFRNVAGGGTREVITNLGTPQDGRTAASFQDKSPVPGAPAGDKDDISFRFEDGDVLALERNRSLLRALLIFTRERNTLLGADQVVAPNGIHFALARGQHIDYASSQPPDSEGFDGNFKWATAPGPNASGWVKEGGKWRAFILPSPPPPPV